MSSDPMDPALVKLLQHGRDLVDKHQHEDAIKFFERAVHMQPNNSMVLDEAAEAAIDAGMPQLAFPWLQQSIHLAPEANARKHLHIGQLQTGTDALQSFQRGAQLLQRDLALHPEDTGELRTRICQALCSIAELYMTDLCDEDNAESECERHLIEAQTWDPNNAEMLVQLSNLRLCQQRPEEAVAPCIQAAQIITALPEEERPPIDCRVGVAKLLIEMKMIDQAIEWLKDLLVVDDEYIETWYLLAFAHNVRGEEEACKECLEEGLAVVEKCEDDTEQDPEVVARLKALADEKGVVLGAMDEGSDGGED